MNYFTKTNEILPYFYFYNSIDGFSQHLGRKSNLVPSINIEVSINVT